MTSLAVVKYNTAKLLGDVVAQNTNTDLLKVLLSASVINEAHLYSLLHTSDDTRAGCCS